jgi:predicted HTH transcriptional regulator
MGSMIQLKVRNIVNGRLSLAPSKTQSIADIAAKVETIESDHIGEEGQTVEYKSSFVFTCDGIADIEKQLGQEIMRQVAAFMNCNGGTIYIGYRDDGTVCGIEKDLEIINDDTSDRFNPYKLTIDGITLKFQNTISRVLGSLASRNVSVRVKKDERSGKLICKLVVTPRSQLVWLNGRRLFIRCQNTVQELYGDEIIQFHEDRQREWK